MVILVILFLFRILFLLLLRNILYLEMIGLLEFWVLLIFRFLNNILLILLFGLVVVLLNRKFEIVGFLGFRLINVGFGIVWIKLGCWIFWRV